MTISYVYEFRDGDTIIATGRLSRERALNVDDTVEINGRTGIVRHVSPTLDPNEQRLMLEPA
jgi:hypothetical protein